MTDTVDVPLEFPDYKRLNKLGENGRIYSCRSLDAPKIFCSIILKLSVSLGRSRNGVGLNYNDAVDVAETMMGISDDLIIDVILIDQEHFDITLRDFALGITAGSVFPVTRYDVSVTVSSIIDTLDDSDEDRRRRISSIVAADVHCDALYLTVPQTWVVPDPEFRPRTNVLPLYPGSFWLTLFKSSFGVVNGASIVFGQDGPASVGLAVRFREVKALRQALLCLYERYLIHPREGLGMKLPNCRLVRYSAVSARAVGAPAPRMLPAAGAGGQGFQVADSESVMAAAARFSESKEIPLTVAEAFQKLLEKVEKLDRENQRLLSLLVEEAEGDIIPLSGQPPWRQ
jgi:hypothetical protein